MLSLVETYVRDVYAVAGSGETSSHWSIRKGSCQEVAGGLLGRAGGPPDPTARLFASGLHCRVWSLRIAPVVAFAGQRPRSDRTFFTLVARGRGLAFSCRLALGYDRTCPLHPPSSSARPESTSRRGSAVLRCSGTEKKVQHSLTIVILSHLFSSQLPRSSNKLVRTR